jgi:ADP-ribose pyrophosphatase
MSKKVLASGKYLSLVVKDGYEMVERINCTGVVLIIAVTDERELVLVEQFRPAVGRKMIELPAGLVGDVAGLDRESMMAAAIRELEEETGFRANRLMQVGQWPTSCGMTSEVVHAFRADRVTRVGDGGGDENEKITVHLAPVQKAHQWLFDMASRPDFYVDPKVHAALYLLGKIG